MNVFIKTCNSCLLILLIGLIGAIYSLTPLAISLEENLGLSWLFKARGAMTAPDKVVIVSIDKISAEILHLPDDPEKWPRTYYARLIEKINQQKPALIGINITFNEKREAENDLLLAQAIAKNKNIILSNYLKRNVIASTNPLNAFSYERIINPIPILQQAALDTAPFPLPKTASTVKQFWTHKKSAGGIATFPGTIFQYYVFKQLYSEILQLLYQLNPPINSSIFATVEQLKTVKSFNMKTLQKIQNEISYNDNIREQLIQLLNDSSFSIDKTRLLHSWLTFLNGSNSLYFNHYGKAGTITTIPFYQALVSDIINPETFHNKIVLLGYSEDIEPERSQGLYTVFSSDFGDTTSPIEIAATAVANLINHNWIHSLNQQQQFFLIFSWGVILSIICRLLAYKLAISLIISISIGYIIFAHSQFSNTFLWLPLIIPIMIQMPLVLVIASVVNYKKRKREHQNMHKAFSLYLPDDVVNHAVDQRDINVISRYGELMQGVCMATDAGQYTTLSETMNPLDLSDLMNTYYGVMFPQVKQQKGIISDVIGDAMLAIWAHPAQTLKIRANACHAALKIIKAIHQFNASQPYQLPTRLGLHFGEMRLGNVGTMDHFEYRAVGDTVNTATRIEGLNKILGTQILVSAEVIHQLNGFYARELGFFILKGKSQAIHIHQLIAEISGRSHPQFTYLDIEFSKGLKFFQQQQWSKALAVWLALERVSPGDGPTRFYISYLKQNLHLSTIQQDSNTTSVIKIGNITSPLAFQDQIRIE